MSGCPRPLRLAATLVVFALLGAVATVAVAWGCTRYSNFNINEEVSDAHVVAMLAERGSPEVQYPVDSYTMRGFGIKMLECTASEDESGPTNFAGLFLFDSGWPTHCLRAEWLTSGHTSGRGKIEIEQRYGFSTGRSPRDGQPIYDDFTLPTHPLWPGFAVNTAFYGALFAFLWFAPGVVRRRVRRRRGQCPACGYPRPPQPPHDISIDTNTCSECGAALHSRSHV